MASRTLNVGVRLAAGSCVITIEGRPVGFLADGWCSICQASHVIDAGLYLRGEGPWRPAPSDRGDER